MVSVNVYSAVIVLMYFAKGKDMFAWNLASSVGSLPPILGAPGLGSKS